MADNSTDTTLTPDLVAFIRSNTVAELVEGVFYGIEALLAAFVCFLLWNQGLSWPRRLLLGVTLMMFIDSTIAVIGDIRYVAVQYQAMVDPTVDPWPTIQLWNALIAVFCRISYFLGDIIVLWRAWVLYQQNIAVKIFLGICTALSLGCAIFDTIAATRMDLADNAFTSARYLLPAAVIFVNAVSTALIGYRAWEHRKFIAAHLETTSRKSQVMSCFVLLIESGALYCVFWVLILLSMVLTNFDAVAGPYLNVILPHVEAIYPTAIILLTALRKTHCDSTLQTAQIQSQLQFASAPSTSTRVARSVHFRGDGMIRAIEFDKEGAEDGKERVDQMV